MAKDVVIASAARTPIGKFQGAFGSLSAIDLGVAAAKAAITRAGIEASQVDEVIMGCVLSAGLGQNPARQVLIGSGIPETVGAFSVNKVCGSGLKAVMLAAQSIKAGDCDLVLAGGMECMSNAPYLLPSARAGQRLGHGEMVDSMINDGLWDVYNNFHMGNTAELVANKYHVSRETQDEYAVECHRKAVAAQSEGRFTEEIVPVEVPRRKKDPLMINSDEGPRADASLKRLASLRPAFNGDSVTAGNASTINDGGCALIICSAEKANALGITPIARILDYCNAGLAPEWVMMTPVPAIKRLFERTGWHADQVDLFEINEAFAVQACAVVGELGLAVEKVNVNGGAVALGHPIGASGARILTTLVHALRLRNLNRGVASLCMGGGNGLAIAIESI